MEKTTTQITIRLTEEQKQQLFAAAEQEQRPVANLVKVAISEYLDRHKRNQQTSIT